jgi:hydrogenase nickel incorporation protein HypA/HybF
MHEWALSDSVAAGARRVMEENKLRKINKITVVLGQVQGIAPAAFTDTFNEIKAQYPGLEQAELALENEPALFKCNECGAEFPLLRDNLEHDVSEDIHFVPETVSLFISCPNCGSKDFSILKGRGLYIKDVEGDK